MDLELDGRLTRIEQLLAALVERETVKEWYTTEEFSRAVGRSEFTVREWCRHARVNAVKKDSGRGAYPSWAISHVELVRFRREGLLPSRGSSAAGSRVGIN